MTKPIDNPTQYILKRTNRDNDNINSARLTHLRFADDVALITDRLDDIKMLKGLKESSKIIRLKIHFAESQIMTNLVLGQGI